MGGRIYRRIFELVECLTEAEQVDVNAKVILLQKIGPSLPRPHADLIHSSRHPNLKELRVRHLGRPYRVLFAFDPRRCAILLIGGDKTGNGRWYEEFVPIADALYDQHLETLKKEEKQKWLRTSKNFKQKCLVKRAFVAKRQLRK